MPATTATKPTKAPDSGSRVHRNTTAQQERARASARRRRGIALYKRFAGRIRRVADETYLVPSQTGAGLYLVYAAEGAESCQCPDFRRHSRRDASGRQTFLCKHYHAVRLFKATSTECAGCGAELLAVTLYPSAPNNRARCAHCAQPSPAHDEPAARLAS